MTKMIRILHVILLMKVGSSLDIDVRIVGFRNRPHHGRVEIFYSGEWGTVCDDNWDMDAALVVCRQLGFPGAVRATGSGEVPPGTGRIWLDDITCNGNESRLSNCTHGEWDPDTCYHNEDAGVICDRGIRVENSKSNEGSLEVFLNESWYSVCRDTFDIEVASVACKELGFTEALAIINVFKDKQSNKILLSTSCDGSEKRLTDCSYNVGASRSCPNNLYAGVICKEDALSVRIHGELPVDGRVEILQSINWLPVCADRNWDINNGEVVCRELGFPALENVTTYINSQGVPKMNVWKYSIYCNGSEKSVFGCSSKDDLPLRCHKLAKIRCKSVLRLVGMNSVNVGRLEAFSGNTWGTVCKIGWVEENGIVACRELGFPGFMSSLHGFADIPLGSEKIAYTNVACLGNENQLSKCENNFGEPCYHYQDIGLVCNKKIRLSGLNDTAGRLEIFYNGKWGSVDVKGWTRNHTRAACKELGFPDGESQLTRALVPQGSEMIWTMDGNCTGEEMSLGDCIRVKNVSGSKENEIGIKCKPVIPSVRLRGGTSTMGTLEIFHQGEWGSLCNVLDTWNEQASKLACQELGFPGFKKMRKGTIYSGIIWKGDFQCTENKTSIYECINIRSMDNTGCSHWNDVSLECQKDTILINTVYSIPEEAVQVYQNDSWGKICDDGSWNDLNSKVVCTSLGYNTKGVIYKSIMMETNKTEINEKWFSNVTCDGSENSLTNCLYVVNNKCPNRKYIGIKCKPIVRLNGDHPTPFYGRLELVREDIWGSVCLRNGRISFQTRDADMVCRELGFPGVISVIPMTQPFKQQVIDSLNCLADEKKLANCVPLKWQNKSCPGEKVAGVVCKPDVRLQDGPAAHEGFLEIFWKNEWSRICSPGITMNEAGAICVTLGYGKPLDIAYKSSNYTGRLWMNNITCTGDENFLHFCNYGIYRQQNCSYQLYPYIKCGLKESKSTLRIVGSRNGQGRVEFWHYGTWGTICDGNWYTRKANVVCNILGFPGAFAAFYSKRVANREVAIWSTDFDCTGNENSLHECADLGLAESCFENRDAGVICNKGIRLRNKARQKIDFNEDQAGALEVYNNKSWGVVCSKNWNMNAAKVACRQLGYPTVQRLSYVSALCNDTTKFWLTSISCNGSENTLLECKDAVWDMNPCLDGKEVELHCSVASNDAVRLVGGSSKKEGEVQILSKDIWGALCHEIWNDDVAKVICRQLGFTGVIRSDKVKSDNQIQAGVNWKANITCQGDEKKLNDCKLYDVRVDQVCNHVSIKCQQDIRISGGINQSNGAIELYYGGKWFPVCGDVWSINDGSVACQHLGYPLALKVSRMDAAGLFSEDERWTTVSCSGNEKSLNLCHKKIIPRSECDKVANVECEPGIRLVGSSRPNEGRVEIFSHGSWGTICDDKFDMIDANVICKELGYIGASSKNVIVNKAADSSMKIHINELECDPGDYFWHCSHYNFNAQLCDHSEDIKVSCISVALGESVLFNEGRIDIYNEDVRSFAISNSHNNKVAEVACREMGFPGAWSHYAIPIENGQVFSVKNIVCQGDEHAISECRYMNLKNQNFNGSNVLGVVCESQIRLRGFHKPNEGRVEVYFNEAWGTVCDDMWDENMMNGKVACQQLGYTNGSMIFNKSTPPGSIPNSLDDVNCLGNENNLLECRYIRGVDSDCSNDEDVGIRCKTELPGRPTILTVSNGTSISFDILIEPPRYPGYLKNIYVYPKLVKDDRGELVDSAVKRQKYFKHSRNLNVQISGYYHLYSISISVENDAGEGNRTWVLLRTEENVPSAPRILTQTNGSLADSINVTWEKPENPNGIIIGYNVYWEKRERKIKVTGKVTIHDKRLNHYAIINLDPDSSYLVQLSAFTSKGEGERFRMVINTSSRVPPTQPTSTEPRQSNPQSTSTDNPSNKITMALAIIFGTILVFVTFFFMITKTSLLQKFRAQLHKTKDENAHIGIAEFENKVYDLSACEFEND